MQVLKGRFFHLVSVLIFFVFLTTYQSNFKLEFTFFKIKKINILETKYLEEEIKNEIYNKLINKDLFFVDRNYLNVLFSKSEWVEQYYLKKLYPNQINLIIKEFYPIAAQRLNNILYIINSDFRKIKMNNDKQLKLLTIIGDPEIDEIKNLYNNLLKNKLIPNIITAEYKNSLRWDLKLKNNSIILLARDNLEEQLEMLPDILKNVQIFKTVDLRFKYRFIVNNYD